MFVVAKAESVYDEDNFLHGAIMGQQIHLTPR